MAPVKTDDLYLMQSILGHLKIGRARDPERRRRGLEMQAGMPIDLLLVRRGEGHREVEMHFKLDLFCLKGEWFVCTEESRAAFQAAFECPIRFSYPIKRKKKPTSPYRRDGKKRPERIARRKMADGTIKTYRYPPWWAPASTNAKAAKNPKNSAPVT